MKYKLAIWSMPHSGENGFVISPYFFYFFYFFIFLFFYIFFLERWLDCMAIFTSSHHVYT